MRKFLVFVTVIFLVSVTLVWAMAIGSGHKLPIATHLGFFLLISLGLFIIYFLRSLNKS